MESFLGFYVLIYKISTSPTKDMLHLTVKILYMRLAVLPACMPTSVYPLGHYGATGIAFEAGIMGKTLLNGNTVYHL